MNKNILLSLIVLILFACGTGGDAVTATTEGDRNITNQYSLNTNIKSTYYDYSFIERKKDILNAKRKAIESVFDQNE